MDTRMESFDWLPDYKDIMACDKETEFLGAGEVNGEKNKEEVLPPEVLQQEEQHYWNDISYSLGMLPFVAREIWAVIDAILDQYEYSGSPIYVENPDQKTLERIVDEIFTQLKYYEDRPNVETPDGTLQKNYYYIPTDEKTSYMTPLRTAIFIMALWNINDRRQRYWRRQRVFTCESYTAV